MKESKPIFYRSEQQAQHLIVAELRPIDHVVGAHWHNFFELELVVSGEGEQHLNHARYALTRGAVTLLRFTDYHQIDPKENLMILNISFEEALLSQQILTRLYGAKDLFFTLSPADFEVLELIGRLMVLEYQTPRPSLSYLQNLLQNLLLKLLGQNDGSYEDTKAELLPSVIRYLRENYAKNPSLTETARHFGYNPEYFSAMFHQKTGIKYSDYLLNLKLNHARFLLLHTEEQIEYIGCQCGFFSYAAFRRAFHQKYGISPRTLRKQG